MYDYIRKENLMWEKERLVEAVCKTGKMQENPRKKETVVEDCESKLLLVLRIHEDLLLCIVV